MYICITYIYACVYIRICICVCACLSVYLCACRHIYTYTPEIVQVLPNKDRASWYLQVNSEIRQRIQRRYARMLMFLLRRHSLRRTVNILILGVYLCVMLALFSSKWGHTYTRNIHTHLIHNAPCRRWSSWQFPRACRVAVRPPALPSRCIHRTSAYISIQHVREFCKSA